MAKRFTDTEKWKKDWFLNLTPVEKTFWMYLLDSCSAAGIWDVSWKRAEFHIGTKLNIEKITKKFAKQFVPLDGGRRWFLIDFVPFQYKQLRPDLNPHKGVIEELRKSSLINEKLCIVLPDCYLASLDKDSDNPSLTLKDKDMDKDKDKGKDKDKDSLRLSDLKRDILLTIDESEWYEAFRIMRAKKNPMTVRAEILTLEQLQPLHAKERVAALKICVERGWQGIKYGIQDVKASPIHKRGTGAVDYLRAQDGTA